MSLKKREREFDVTYFRKHRENKVLVPRKRRRKGDVLLNPLLFPTDLIYEIASFFSGHELITILYVNKAFNSLFSITNPMLRRLWIEQTTFDLVNHSHSTTFLKSVVPIIQNCPRYLSLLHFKGCEMCHKKRIRKIYSPFLVRVCESCFESITIRDYILSSTYGISIASQLKDIPSIYCPTWNAPYLGYKLFLKEQVEHHLGRSLDIILQEKRQREKQQEDEREQQRLGCFELVKQHPFMTKWKITPSIVAPSSFRSNDLSVLDNIVVDYIVTHHL